MKTIDWCVPSGSVDEMDDFQVWLQMLLKCRLIPHRPTEALFPDARRYELVRHLAERPVGPRLSVTEHGVRLLPDPLPPPPGFPVEPPPDLGDLPPLSEMAGREDGVEAIPYEDPALLEPEEPLGDEPTRELGSNWFEPTRTRHGTPQLSIREVAALLTGRPPADFEVLGGDGDDPVLLRAS